MTGGIRSAGGLQSPEWRRAKRAPWQRAGIQAFCVIYAHKNISVKFLIKFRERGHNWLLKYRGNVSPMFPMVVTPLM
ncbi:hypothetical protein J6590_056649 [Homalodisca vitripennis]|nr:hypothetical protein J6590_056649 [Homalodisca vitripennis]